MKDYCNPSGKIEFDLFDLLWRLLMQWKAVLIVCIIMALLLPGAKYMKDNRAYENAVKEQKKAEKEASRPVDERIEEVLSQLPNEQRDDVLFVMQQRELVKRQKDYLNNSLLLNSNPTRQRQISYKFLIENSSNVDTQTLRDAYDTCLKREDFIKTLREVISPEAKLEYIYELVNPETNEKTGSNDSSELLSLNIVVPDDTDIEALTAVVDSTIANAHDELSKNIGEHSLTQINIEDNHIYNENVANQRSSITLNINSLNTSIDNAKSKLSNEQKAALDAITIIENTANTAEAASDKAVDAKVSADMEKPGVSKKYALLGFLLGLFLYAGVYILILILDRKLSSVSAVSRMTGTRLLGEIYRLKKRTGLGKLFSSSLVASWRYGNKLDALKQSDAVADVIDAVCTHNAVKKVTFLMSGIDECFNADINHIIDKCRTAKDIIEEISIMDIDSLDEKHLTAVGSAIYVVSSDTRTDTLGKITSICKDYGISSIGSIFLDAV